MFLVGELGATIDGDSSPFMKELDYVAREGGRRIQQIGKNLTAGLTLPLVGAGGLALKTAADYESLRQSMDILNGSAEEGARNFERLKEFSAGTPFQLNDLAKAQNMLQGFSLSADDAFESMSMIGDIAAVTGGSIQGIGVAFGQAAAEGRLMTRDIRQLINQGVPAIQLLADTMGVATSEVLDLASEGKVSFEILQQAFRDATSEGGMFADGMEKQASTLAGLFSTLKDNTSIALAEIGNSMEEAFSIKELMRGFISSIKSATQWFSDLSDGAKQLAFMVGGLAAAIGPLSLALGTVMRMLPTLIAGFKKLQAVLLTNPWYAIASAISFVGTRAVLARKSLNALKASIEGVIDEGNNLEAVNAKIAELGEKFEEAARVADTIPGMEAEDIVDPELLDQLNRLVTLQRELSAQQLQMDINTRKLDDLSDFITFVNTQFKPDAIARPFIEAKKPIDEIIPALDQLEQGFRELSADEILADEGNINIGDKIFPPGSLGAMQDKMRQLRESLRMATDPGVIQSLKDEINNLESEMSEFSDTAVESGRNANMAMGALGNSIGNVVGQLIRGKKEALSFGNILSAVAPALINVLTGGSGGFVSTLASGIFGGFRANGGPVMAGQSYVVGESGREVFTPSTNGSISPMGSSGGGTKRVQLNITGNLTGQGSTLRAVINESQYIDLS